MAPEEIRTLSVIAVDAAQQRLASAAASRAGWRVQSDAERPSALLIGRWDGDVAERVRRTRQEHPALPILVCGETSASVEAIRAGATDFLTLPLKSDRLVAALQAASDRRRRNGELRQLAEKIVKPLAFDEIVGSTPSFRAALAIAAKAARSRVAVLIEGEKGTGKETVARAIHASGPRAQKTFVTVDCDTLSPVQLEACLFGYERGAFPGAFDRSIGRIEQADGGTLFLDAIEVLPAGLQAKLLQFLDTGEVTRMGARGFRAVDVRIIGAAGGGLAGEVAEGRFREDLRSRLAMVSIQLPTLRERRADIPALARHFLGRFAEQPGLPHLGITEDALGMLVNFGWSGNVRELQTALFRAALHCQGHALTASDFPQIAREIAQGKRSDDYHARPSAAARPASSLAPASGITLFLPDGHLRLLEDIEADVIRLAIGHYQGRMTEVARRLGIGRSTLYRKLAELGISDAA